MPIQVGLNLLTLVMCVITLTLATAALMPQIAYGLRLLRDGVLWAILLGIIAFVGIVGWGRLYESRAANGEEENKAASVLRELLDSTSPKQKLDPLPLPTAKAQPVRVAESAEALPPLNFARRTQPVSVQLAAEVETTPKTKSSSPFQANRSRQPRTNRIGDNGIASDWEVRRSSNESDWTARGSEPAKSSDWNR